MLVGSGKQCDIRVNSAPLEVESRHCCIKYSANNDHWEITDLGANTPAIVNGGLFFCVAFFFFEFARFLHQRFVCSAFGFLRNEGFGPRRHF